MACWSHYSNIMYSCVIICVYYPHTFLKTEGDIVIASVRLSVRPLCYLLLNHWSKFNMNGVCNIKLFWPRPLGRDQKVKYHLMSITKSISKIFIPNFVCVLTNERYKTNQKGFSFCCLGYAPGVGLLSVGGAQGGKKNSIWSCGISNRRG